MSPATLLRAPIRPNVRALRDGEPATMTLQKYSADMTTCIADIATPADTATAPFPGKTRSST
jgi:hypothetical protein